MYRGGVFLRLPTSGFCDHGVLRVGNQTPQHYPKHHRCFQRDASQVRTLYDISYLLHRTIFNIRICVIVVLIIDIGRNSKLLVPRGVGGGGAER